MDCREQGRDWLRSLHRHSLGRGDAASATKELNLSATPRERVLLIGTYDLGHQPFGLASPAAWLSEAGFQVDCLDLSRSELDTAQVAGATVIAFYVPMHTATRLALDVLPVVRDINPTARVCLRPLLAG